MQLNRYRVKKGTHVGADGKSYTKGQVVTSAKDLVAMFPEKFENLGPTEVRVKVEPAKEPEDKGIDTGSAEETPTPAAKRTGTQPARARVRR